MKNKKKMIIILCILATIILAFLGGKTFSKYTAKVEGSGAASIAGWRFNVNGDHEIIQNISLSSTYNNDTILYNKLAPGTDGSFDIIVDATGSEVGVNYNVDFKDTAGAKPTNLKFKYDNNEYNNLEELESVLSGTIPANEENKVRTYTIQWEWPYETGEDEYTIAQNDKIDTEEAGYIYEYGFDVCVTGTQVVPQ